MCMCVGLQNIRAMLADGRGKVANSPRKCVHLRIRQVYSKSATVIVCKHHGDLQIILKCSSLVVVKV